MDDKMPSSVKQKIKGKSNIIVAGSNNVINKIVNVLNGDAEHKRAMRNRQAMLNLVYNTWVEGLLKNSLYNEVLINLDLKTRPDMIDDPWKVTVHFPNQAPRTLPAGKKIFSVFEEASSSLLILGEPGSGKTTTLLELAKQAIEYARTDPLYPIPVIYNLSSWTPKFSIEEWAINELMEKYRVSRNISSKWVENDELMFLLDGLDEVNSDYRVACIEAIKHFIENHNVSIAVCCRKEDYEALNIKLALRAAVIIQPLETSQVVEYFERVSPNLLPIFNELSLDSELSSFLKTPLLINIFLLTYQNSSIENIKTIPFQSKSKWDLFNAYVENMFIRRKVNDFFTPEQVKSKLGWLAYNLTKHDQAIFYLETLSASWLKSAKLRTVFMLVKTLFIIFLFGLIGKFLGSIFKDGWALLHLGISIGVTYGIMSFLQEKIEYKINRNFAWKIAGIGLFVSVSYWLCFGSYVYLMLFLGGDEGPWNTYYVATLTEGVLLGLVLGTVGGLQQNRGPVEKMGWSWKGARQGIITGGKFGLVFSVVFVGIIYYLGDFGNEFDNFILLTLFSSLIIGIIISVIGGIHGGLRGTELLSRNSPAQGIWASGRNSVIFGVSMGVLGLGIGLLVGPFSGAVGFLIAASGGLLYNGGYFFISHFVLKIFLLVFQKIPWNLIKFLDHSTDRIFLRKIGGGYIFVHRMVMEYFAEHYYPDKGFFK